MTDHAAINAQLTPRPDRAADAPSSCPSQTLTQRPDDVATDVAAAWAGAVAPPPVIEGYRLIEPLGEGGMGVVYKAEHLALKRVVAVKMIRSGALASADELLRFRIEAEAVARLQHPNIVQIFDVGQHEGLRYLSLEFVAGGTLAARIENKPQPPREAAAIVERLARAVHVAHLHGIVHRDLKPHNVLLAPDGMPKISDFGLAKLIAGDDGAHSYMMVGTAGYMAPEQAWGGGPASEIGPASDVYGLGVILYELLTGRLPFRGSTPRDTLEQVWTQEPPRPRSFQPGVPRDLETICLKCLEKIPHRRYASAEALADDLRRYLADEPIAARPVGVLERAAKWARRRPAIASLVGVAAAALLAIAVVAGAYQIQVNRNYALAKANLAQAQAAIDQLINGVSIEGLAPIPHSESLRRNLLETALGFCARLQADNPNDPELARQSAKAQRQMADLNQLLNRASAAAEGYRAAIKSFESLPRQARDDRELAVAYNNFGNLQERTSDVAGAVESYAAALDKWQRLTKDHPAQRDYQHGLAATLNNLGIALTTPEPAKARAMLDEAVDLRRRLAAAPDAGEARLELVGSLNNLANLLRIEGHDALAEELLREGLAELARLDAQARSNPLARATSASTWNNLGAVLARQGKTEPAEEAYRQAISEFEPLVSDFPAIAQYRQGLADTRSNLGSLLAKTDRLDEAQSTLAASIADYESLLAASPGATARLGLLTALTESANVSAQRKQTGEADAAILRATKLGAEMLAQASPPAAALNQQSIALQTMARFLAARRMKGDARRQLEQAVNLSHEAATAEPNRGDYRATLRTAYARLSSLLIELGEADAAAQAAEEIAGLFPNQADASLESAQLLAQCIPLATGLKGSMGSPAADAPLDEHCARRAAGLLAKVARQQGKSLDELAADPAFAPLVERSEFKAAKNDAR